MTVFAGAFSLGAGKGLPADAARDLSRSLSREPTDQPEVFQGDGYAVAFVDLGLLPGRGDIVDSTGVRTFLSGDPLVTSRSERSRTDDLELLHDACLRNDESVFRRARGSFSLVQIDPAAGVLRLMTDKLGVRPLFVAFQNGFVYFSTALRVLEAMSSLTLRDDVRGLIETVGFGYALVSRTRYEGVELLNAGEMLEVRRDKGVRRTQYWSWTGLADAGLNERDLRRRLHETFDESVRWRLGRERSIVALLSGGMDSRVAVTSARDAGAEVHSISLGPRGSLDFALARMIAKHLGTRHYEYSKPSLDAYTLTAHAHRAWMASIPPNELPDNPRAVWTGHGGSVGMGHTYLTDQMVQLTRQGERAAAVAMFLRVNGVVLNPRVFRKELRGTVETCCSNGMLDQVRDLHSFDEARRLHLFLMLNDQRRHLAPVYEDIDQARLEYINPFFDSTFLEVVLQAPVDLFMAHRLYNLWLKDFPSAIDTVPWQAYPGHEPCPLPMPEGLSSQWEQSYWSTETAVEFKRKALEQAAAALASPDFPDRFASRTALRVAWLLTKTGVRDYSYLLKMARVLCRDPGKSAP